LAVAPGVSSTFHSMVPPERPVFGVDAACGYHSVIVPEGRSARSETAAFLWV
jgi:hypothetical protein